jgi:hypothetical protein
VEYNNIKEACIDLGLPYTSVRLKMRKGKSFSEAIKRDDDRKTVVEYNGVKYSSIKEACKSLGLAYSSVLAKMNNDNMSFEDIVKNYKSI